MIHRLPWVVLMLSVAACRGWALDTIQLKGQGAITGHVLAEKKDQLVVDLGYTVLLVPRQEILKVTSDAPADTASATAKVETTPASAAVEADGLYATAKGSLPEGSVRELVAQVGEAVVQVRTPGGLGSGFFINEAGYLITNFHVIEGETQISVEVYHQRDGQLERKTYKQVRIIAMNKFQDLALLKVEGPDIPRFARALLGETDTLAVGEHVFAVGSPLGLERTVTEGIISTKTREMQGDLYLQTTAQINPGNSGGPLFNLRGEVIGVTNMKINFGEGLGFAIPVEAVRNFLKRRDAFAFDNNNPSNGYRYLEPPTHLQHSEPEHQP